MLRGTNIHREWLSRAPRGAPSLVRRKDRRAPLGCGKVATVGQNTRRPVKQNQARMRAVRETGMPVILAGTVPQDDAPPLHFDAIILRAWAPNHDAMWNVVGIFVHAR